MVLRRRAVALTATCAVAAPLLGCIPTVEDAKAQAIAKGQAHCAAEGKQFALVDASGERIEGFWEQGATATIVGHCIGPNDPGFVAPSRPK